MKEPRLAGKDPDSDEMLVVHSKILYEKPMIREVFEKFYDTCIALDNQYFGNSKEQRIEIGASVSFFSKKYPQIISTDIKHADNLDMVVDAQNMPFENNTIRAIYGINCFHHLPNPNLFFKELERTLDIGCACILIDPYYGFTSRRFYKKIFNSEIFDMDQKEWVNESLGFMNGANQALSYIVFQRDKKKMGKHVSKLRNCTTKTAQ